MMRLLWLELFFEYEGEHQSGDSGDCEERGPGHAVPEIFVKPGVEIDAQKDDAEASEAAVFQACACDDLGNTADGESKDP